jgi:rubrerythrin
MSINNHEEDFLEPLRIARRLEEEGRQFFIDTARKTESKLARQTFEFLANEEVRHLEKINQFYHSLEKEGAANLPVTEKSSADARLEAFNKQLESLKDEFKPSMSDIEAYEYAIKFENGAEEFYEEKLNDATNPRIKQFYQWLVEEETMHGRLLNSCLKFVEDPAGWFRSRKHR